MKFLHVVTTITTTIIRKQHHHHQQRHLYHLSPASTPQCHMSYIYIYIYYIYIYTYKAAVSPDDYKKFIHNAAKWPSRVLIITCSMLILRTSRLDVPHHGSVRLGFQPGLPGLKMFKTYFLPTYFKAKMKTYGLTCHIWVMVSQHGKHL